MTQLDQLLSNSQLTAVREVAKLGMITPVTIERRAEAAIPVGGDYGDDFISYTETSESNRQTLKGWFYSRPEPVQSIDTGAVVTVNTYRLYLPVGTDVLPGDIVTVGESVFTVSDTTAESTWNPLLTCSLRKRE